MKTTKEEKESILNQIEDEFSRLQELNELNDLRLSDIDYAERDVNFLIDAYNEISNKKLPRTSQEEIVGLVADKTLLYA